MNGLGGINPGLLGGGMAFDDVEALQVPGLGDGIPSTAGLPLEDHSPLYLTDEFRIYFMKVLPCSKRYVHDWTTCPFAHTGEKARRRDPRLHNYTGIACPDMKKNGNCIRGDRCPYAHNVFEYWLHPTRYRTQLCNDGRNCARRVCFFAHTLEEVRLPKQKPYVSPEAVAAASLEALAEACNDGGVGGAAGLGESLAPAGAGALYKSFSCPANPPQYGPTAVMQQLGLQAQLNTMGLAKLDENESYFVPASMPAASHAPQGAMPSSMGMQGGRAPTMPGTAPSTREEEDDGEILNSLAALKAAMQRSRLPQDAVVNLLAELLTDRPQDTSSAAMRSHAMQQGPAASGSKDDLAIPSMQQQRGGYMAPPQPSLGSSPPDQELLAAMPKPSGGLWHTASVPTGRIDRRSAAAVAATAGQEWRARQAAAASSAPSSSSLPGSAQDVAGGGALEDFVSRAFTGAGSAVNPALQRAALEELLHQSAATQSSAAANGQASQQAKLAKAKSLNTWLNKLKQQGGREAAAAAVVANGMQQPQQQAASGAMAAAQHGMQNMALSEGYPAQQ